MERPKKTPYIPRYYSLGEANELLDKLRGHWLWLPVMLCLFYGLRRSEVLGIQWRSVDLSVGTIQIQHTRVYQEVNGRKVSVGRDTMKQKASCRTLPMPEEIAAILQEEKRNR